jgi:putative Holliday junction resolvase
MVVIAVDPGEKRLGIAISDPTGTIANPLVILEHVSRTIDAASIAQLAMELGAALIIIGQALDAESRPTPQARRAARLAGALRAQTSTPVLLWDESGSTQAARQSRLELGVPKSKRRGHFDDLAATFILQTYLDADANQKDNTAS